MVTRFKPTLSNHALIYMLLDRDIYPAGFNWVAIKTWAIYITRLQRLTHIKPTHIFFAIHLQTTG